MVTRTAMRTFFQTVGRRTSVIYITATAKAEMHRLKMVYSVIVKDLNEHVTDDCV
jgi:hypothetical protein